MEKLCNSIKYSFRIAKMSTNFADPKKQQKLVSLF